MKGINQLQPTTKHVFFNKWIFRIICLAGYSLSISTALAQATFTLDDLITTALNTNPEVLAARDQSKVVQAQLIIARAIPNPEFELSSGQQKGLVGTAVGNVSALSILQPLDMPYNRTPRISVAQANIKVANAVRISFEMETIAKVEQRFYELMRREAESRAAQEDLDLTKQIRDRMQVRYEVGEAARFDLIRAQTEFLNSQISAQSSQLRIEQARSQLRQVVGYQLPVQFVIKAEPPKTEILPELTALQLELQSQSPELKKARADIEVSESKINLEKNARLPRLSLRAQQNTDPNVTDRLFGIVLSIPIWDFKNGQIAESLANASKAKNQLDAQSQSLESQMDIAYQLYRLTSNQVRILDQEVVELAASARRIAEVSYRYGERGMLEYLDAQRTFRAARNDLIKARFDLASVLTEIKRLRASPDWLAKIEGGLQ